MLTWEPLGGGISAAVDDTCRVSLDGVLLARFAEPQAQDTALDLGTGNGLIPLCWCRRDPPKAIIAVEREQAFAALAQQAIARFSLEDRIDLRVCDWNTLHDIKADVITCNPPYFPFGAARPSGDPLKAAARHEDDPTLLSKLCLTAARLLTDKGRFCVCHRPERLADLFGAFAAAGLVPRRLQMVQATADAAPWLVLCEAGTRGVLRILPPLVSNAHGDHTAVYKRLYPKWQK